MVRRTLWSLCAALVSLASPCLAMAQAPQGGAEPGAPAPDAYTPPTSPLLPAPPQAPAAPSSGEPAEVTPVYPPAYPASTPSPTPYVSELPPPTYTGVGALGRAPGAHEHEGFFLRLNAGIGAGGATYRERAATGRVARARTRGLVGTFEVAVGGTVAENLIVHGNLLVTVTGAHKEVDGIEDRGYDAFSTTMWLVGGGITYYVMPSNLFLTLSLGAGGLAESRYDEATDTTDDIVSDVGFASALSVGKEWWVGRAGEWGIGAALSGALFVAPLDVDGVQSSFLGHSVSISFNTTYN